MLNHHESNIAASFFQIHSIITRGLQVSVEHTQAAEQGGFPDESRREGLFKYIQALVSVVNSHHLTEDEIAFPYFREKLPNAPFDRLIEWHRHMDDMLAEIRLAVDKCKQNDQLKTNLGKLENALSMLYESWKPHIQMEYDEFISKADALVPEEEQIKLVRLFSEHGQKIAVPPELTVPFLMYNLPPEERASFFKEVPAEVTEKLVPIVWKPQWEAMAPYLLN